MIVEVPTLDDPRLDAYARLTDVQLRNRLEPEKGVFVAESDKVIRRALAGGMQPLSLLMEPKWLPLMQPVIDHVAQRFPSVPVFVAPHAELERLTGFELTRGALGAFRRPVLPTVAEACAHARRVAVLEDITNHTNVGAIFRSAAALGIDAVLVTPACYDPLYRRAVRVSMGTVFQVPWTRIGDADAAQAPASGKEAAQARPAQVPAAQGARQTPEKAAQQAAEEAGCAAQARLTQVPAAQRQSARRAAQARPALAQAASWAESGIPLLHGLSFKTAALALADDAIPLDDPRLAAEERLALVLGTEGDGLSPATIARCDYTVRIPMHHGVDSLNVAAASAVAFWELRAR